MAEHPDETTRTMRDLLAPGVVFALVTGLVLGVLSTNTELSRLSALLIWLGLSGLVLVLLHRVSREQRGTIDAGLRGGDGDTASDSANVLRALLDRLPLPFMLFGRGRRIRFMNSAARSLLGMDAVGRDFAVAIRNPDVLAAVDRTIAGGAGEAVEFRIPQPQPRSLRVRVEALADDMDSQAGFIALLDDLTDTKRISEVQTGFVADVSHELRTPLASVLSIVETLNGPARDDPAAQARFLPMLDEQATRMARIVDDLLSLSRIEMNEHQRPDDAVRISEVLQAVRQTGHVLAEERNMTIRVDIPVGAVVTGNMLELTRLFQNLVDNAVNYGDRGTEVVVRGRVSGDHVAIAVRDHGPGIEREHIPRLTERFYRVDKGRSREAGGTGLGLAIVKHIVNRHRGRLRVESVVGSGSTFTVELPLRPGEGLDSAVEK